MTYEQFNRMVKPTVDILAQGLELSVDSPVQDMLNPKIFMYDTFQLEAIAVKKRDEYLASLKPASLYTYGNAAYYLCCYNAEEFSPFPVNSHIVRTLTEKGEHYNQHDSDRFRSFKDMAMLDSHTSNKSAISKAIYHCVLKHMAHVDKFITNWHISPLDPLDSILDICGYAVIAQIFSIHALDI